MTLLEWETFYVIVGSSAAALTGLMFVVLTLLADFGAELESTTSRQIEAFGTPTVVHFSAVVLQSAVLSAPWPTLTGARIAIGAYGLAGVVYTVVAMRRQRKQAEYKPVLEDWLFHAVFPLAAYAGVVVAVLALAAHPELLLFTVASAALGLLFIGIHNAWDTVTFIVLSRLDKRRRGGTE